MARYIDADKIPYYLDTSEEAPMEGRKIAFKSDIEKIPTADVAPKSEVERLEVELEAMRCAANSYKIHYENLAREIFEEIKKVSCRISESNQNGFLRVVCYQLSAEKFFELEKKYTEDEHGNKSEYKI